MAESSNIAWTRSTFNGWVGCTKVSPGCDHCYASVSTPARTLGVTWGAGQPRRRTSVANWRGPERWNKLAAEERRLGFAQHTGEDGYVWEYPGFWPVFCSSLADTLPSPASGVILLKAVRHFEDSVPVVVAKVERRAKPNPQADRLQPEQVADIARLATLRLWDALAKEVA